MATRFSSSSRDRGTSLVGFYASAFNVNPIPGLEIAKLGFHIL
jgi:hypothetical protein